MRILRVHNRYQERGGEDVSYEAESKLLRDRAHDVECLEFSNDAIPERRTIADSARLALTTIWSSPARNRIRSVVQECQPDVVHFDNTFPLVSPAAYAVCREAGAAVVQSLRNYRLLCPNATFFRDGHACEDCLGKLVPYPGVIHACYRDSHEQSAVVSTMLTVHRIRRTWIRDVNRYVALSQFAREKFEHGGLPGDRIAVKPNFVGVESPDLGVSRAGFVFAGRLTAEKGLLTLMQAIENVPAARLTIVGDGPLRSTVEQASEHCERILYTGRLPESETYEFMSRAMAVVVPSEFYETFGRVAVEAFACGTPVVVSDAGAIAEIIEPNKTGMRFRSGNADDLAAKVRWAVEHPDEMRRMGENARREYEAKYTPERNYEMLMQIYHDAIDHHRRQQSY